MSLEEANGPKKSAEREVVNPWAVCDVEKWEWATQAQSNASEESKGLMEKLMNSKDEG